MRHSNRANDLEQLLDRYGIRPKSESAFQLHYYHDLLKKWNRRINLVSSTSWKILGPFFEEAIWAARFFPSGETTHLDIGSGAGFPGLPLKVMSPGMDLDMVESRTKKAAFLETVISKLALEHCTVHSLRLAEFLNRERNRKWDSISWKGLKLDSRELGLLFDRCPQHGSFWIFHGRDLPVKDLSFFDDRLQLRRRETLMGREDWRLSIYEKRT